MCFLDVRGKPEHDIEEKETEHDCKEKRPNMTVIKESLRMTEKQSPAHRTGLFIYALNRHEHSGILNTFTISLFLRLTLTCKIVRPTASATRRNRWPHLMAPVSASKEMIFCP